MSNPLIPRVIEALTKMGDPNAEDFPRAEVEHYYSKAQDDFCREVRPFLDMEIFEDLPALANYAFYFEAALMDAKHGQATFRFDFEKQFLRIPGKGPVPISFPFERDLITAPIAAVVTMPPLSIQIERVTWDERRAEPMSSMSFGQGGVDSQYEVIRGPVEAYIADKDGIRSLRRYRIPAGNGSHFDYQNRYGTFRGRHYFVPFPGRSNAMRLGMFARMVDAHTLYAPDVFISLSYSFGFAPVEEELEAGLAVLPLFKGMEVSGSYGIMRRLPGFHPSRRTWGVVRGVRFDHKNTRAEFHSRYPDPRQEAMFGIPDHYLKFLDFFVMAEMYAREGSFQDLTMAQHYQARYMSGVALAKRRMALTNSMRLTVAGGSIRDREYPPPMSRPPENFPEGAFTRRRRGGRYRGF